MATHVISYSKSLSRKNASLKFRYFLNSVINSRYTVSGNTQLNNEESKNSTNVSKSEDNLDEKSVSIQDEKNKLLEQIREYDDKYKRSLAEMENMRNRFQKQIADAKLFGIQGFCKDLLEVADVLNSATETVSKESLNTADSSFKNLYDGLIMTEKQLYKVFTVHGLEHINPQKGDKFDPNFHEALFQTASVDDSTVGSIAVVTKKGYKLYDRTIRAALVGVYK